MSDQSTQTLDSFYLAAQNYGFSRDYQARVTALKINNQSLPDDYLTYLKSVSTPSKKATISTVKYYGVDIHTTGPRNFGESEQWELTFLSDQSLFLKGFFEESLETIASNNPKRARLNPVPGENSYAIVDIVNDNLETVVRYRLNGLFVVSVPGMSYSIDGSGKVQEFKVILGYQTWGKEVFSPQAYPISENGSTPKGSGGSSTGASANNGTGSQPVSTLDSILNGLKTVTQVAGAIRGTANAVGGAAQALRGARTAIRGRR